MSQRSRKVAASAELVRVLGIIAVAGLVVLLAALIMLRDGEAQARMAEALRADINAEYEAFCARFVRSDLPDQHAHCVAALWGLRAWEDDRRAQDIHDPF